MKLILKRDGETVLISDSAENFTMRCTFSMDLEDAKAQYSVTSMDYRMVEGSDVTDVEVFRAIAKLLDDDCAQHLGALLFVQPKFYPYSLKEQPYLEVEV